MNYGNYKFGWREINIPGMINFDFLLRGMGYYKKELPPPKKPKTREIKNIQQKRKWTKQKKEQNPEIKIKQEMSRQTKSKM